MRGGGGGLLGEIDLGKKKDTRTHTHTHTAHRENITIHQPTNPPIHIHTRHTQKHRGGGLRSTYLHAV